MKRGDVEIEGSANYVPKPNYLGREFLPVALATVTLAIVPGTTTVSPCLPFPNMPAHLHKNIMSNCISVKISLIQPY